MMPQASPDWWSQMVQSGQIVPDVPASPAPPRQSAGKPDYMPGWTKEPADQVVAPTPVKAKPQPAWWSQMVQSGAIVPEASAETVPSVEPQDERSSLGGIGQNLAAGLAEGGWNAAAMLPNAANAVANLGIGGVNALAGTNIPKFSTDVGGEASRALAGATGGWSPTEVPANGEWERAARAAGQAPGQLAGMALGGAAVEAAAPLAAGIAPETAAVAQAAGRTLREMPIARNVAPAMAGNAGGQVAQDVAPEPLKPLAAVAGNIVGAGGAGLLQEGFMPAMRAANPGKMGLGFGKEDLGGQRVTPSQAAAVGEQLNVPGLLPKLQAQEANAARVAEIDQRLTEPSLDPAEKGALETERASLLPQTQERIAGSRPTLSEAAITPAGEALPSESLTAINRLEQNARRDNPAAFIARETEQNSARLGAIGAQAPGGEVQSVGKLFTDQLDALESRQATEVGAAAAQRAAAGGAPLGGLGRTEQYGAQMHETLTAAQVTAKKQASRLYSVVDPDNTMAANVEPAKTAAEEVLTSVNPIQGVNTGAELHPGVARMATAMSQMPDVVPFEALRQMRTQVGEVVREIGGNPTMGRESVPMAQAMRLKGAIDQSIQEAVDRATQQSPAGKRILAELETLRDQSANAAVAGDQAGTTTASATNAGAAGTEVPNKGRSGVPAGSAGAAGHGGTGRSVAENITPEQAAAYQRANANYREYKSTFAQGPVGQVLATDRYGARKMPDLGVPAKFFRSGAVDPGAVDAYLKAAGGNEAAVESAKDYLVSELRDLGIVDKNTGAANIAKLDRWLENRAPAIQKLDEATGTNNPLAPRLANARSAQEFYDQTVAEHEARIKEFQNGAAKSFLGGVEPQQAISRALAANDPAKLTDIVKAVRGNPDAVEGLKRGVVDWLTQRMSGATAANESENFLQSQTLQKWIGRNKQPLKMLFGGQGLQTFEMVAADLRRGAQRATAQAGSRTGTEAAAKPGLFGGHGNTLFSLIAGEAAGHVLEHFVRIPLAGEAGGAMGVVVNSLRQHGIETQQALLREALLHPDLARVLMERVNGKPGPVLMRRLAARLQASLLSNQAIPQKDERQ